LLRREQLETPGIIGSAFGRKQTIGGQAQGYRIKTKGDG
jgi:hypothetical protein